MIFRYSNISTAYTCYKKYEIEVIKGIKPEIESTAMNFGTGIHLALATYLETKEYDHSFNMFTSYWNTCAGLDFKTSRDSWDSLLDKGTVFFNRFVDLHSKHYSPKYIEHSINFTLKDFKFSGTPDFIGEFKGIPSIVDFKTSSSVYDKRKIDFNEQMYLYAHAAKQVLDYKAEQLVYTVFIKNPEPRIQTIAVPLDEKLMKINLDNVVMMCKDLSNRTEFPMNKNSCLYCPHVKQCYQ